MTQNQIERLVAAAEQIAKSLSKIAGALYDEDGLSHLEGISNALHDENGCNIAENLDWIYRKLENDEGQSVLADIAQAIANRGD